MLKEIRCTHCDKLLFKIDPSRSYRVEIVCPRCTTKAVYASDTDADSRSPYNPVTHTKFDDTK